MISSVIKLDAFSGKKLELENELKSKLTEAERLAKNTADREHIERACQLLAQDKLEEAFAELEVVENLDLATEKFEVYNKAERRQ
jgi:ribosomal 50S subunit-associated protein YjgA (DUF615 family)